LEKFDIIDRSVVSKYLIQFGAVFPVPDDELAILGSGGEVLVAFAHIDVCYHFIMAVEGSLKIHGVLVPYFDYAKRMKNEISYPSSAPLITKLPV
jgi:hypothetical protein